MTWHDFQALMGASACFSWRLLRGMVSERSREEPGIAAPQGLEDGSEGRVRGVTLRVFVHIRALCACVRAACM